VFAYPNVLLEKDTMPYRRLDKVTTSFCDVDEELEQLWHRTYLSNNALVNALERLRESYIGLLSGTKPLKDKDRILAQVESALIKAAEVKNWL